MIKEHNVNQAFTDGIKVWKILRLIMLTKDLEVFDIPMKHLNINNLFPKIDSTLGFVEQIQYVLDADLECPIILDEEGYVMDGRHRVLRALFENKESIKAVRFDKTPQCCYERVVE